MKFTVFNGTGKTQLYSEDGKKITGRKGKDYFNLIFQTARNEFTQNKQDLSIQEAIDKIFEQSHVEMTEEQRVIYDWILSSLEQYDAADLSELSLKNYGKEMEKDPKSTLNQAMEVLKNLFENTSTLISHELTIWSSNPYTLGSYSFMGVGMTIDDFVLLGEPVQKKLFFAGEATTTYFSHLHSAFISEK